MKESEYKAGQIICLKQIATNRSVQKVTLR